MRIRVAALDDVPAHEAVLLTSVTHKSRRTGKRSSGVPLATRHVSGTMDNPQVIEVPIEIGLHTTKTFGVQEKQHNITKAAWGVHGLYKKKNGYGIPPAIWIDWLELEGPHNIAESSSTKMTWWVDEKTGLSETLRARKIFQQFSLIAFRYVPAGNDYLDGLVKVFKYHRSRGESFETAIREPLSIILASQSFFL